MTPTGALTTLHSFDGTDGATPVAGLIEAIEGNLYGTTPSGGNGPSGGIGAGTVFRVTTSGALTTLYYFCAQATCQDELYQPMAGLIQGSDGNFYGTTYGQQSFSGGPGIDGAGTIFEITAGGVLTTLYRFSGGNDGAFPAAALL